MKFLIIAAACVAVAVADVSHILPKNADADAQVLKQDLDVGVDGSYQWAFETSNGIVASEQGQLKNVGAENEAQVAQGQSQWISPEGQTVQTSYVADENGYQPQGSHIPTPPPIPEAILRSLEYIRAHPPPPEQH